MTLIETTNDIFHQIESQRVYLSDTLSNWGNPVPYFYCDQLNLVAAPSIDQATFSYKYGNFAVQLENGPGGVYERLDLYRKFVKLEILNSSATVIQTWHGYFVTDEQEPAGSQLIEVNGSPAYLPSGIQKPTAVGLLYLLETTIIDSSVVEKRSADPLITPSTSSMKVGRGITFNGVDGTIWAKRGNRSNAISGSYQGYIFSDLPYGASLWDAESAVKYLLEFHRPQTAGGTDVAALTLQGTTGALSWYDKTVDTDLRNVKDVLDDLIDRRRGVGYYVTGDDPGGGFEIAINVFTFADQPVDLGDGNVVPTNADQVTLNFENALDVGDVSLTNNLTQLASSVKVYGAPITVVCTLKPGGEGLKPGWTTDTETDYLAGDSDASDYGTLDRSTQEKRNQVARSREVFEDVFSRFVLDPEFTGKVDHLETGEDEHYILPNVYQLDNITVDDVKQAFATTLPNGDPLDTTPCWWRGKRFLSELPLRSDTSILAPVDSYKRPFVVFEVVADADPDDRVYEFGHKLAKNANNEDPARSRNWSVGLEMLQTEPGVRMVVNGGEQYFIAKNNWATAAATNQAIDPNPDEDFKTGAIDWDDPDMTHPSLWTVAVQSDSRLVVTWESPQAVQDIADNPLLNFAWEREKIMMVPDARLVMIAPGTVTDLTSGGQLVIDTNGSIYEDDRDRLRRIATAAGIWYGTQRQALEFSFRQTNTLGLSLGQLVTSIGANYSQQNVNSVITGLRLDLLNIKTTLETSFVELDFITERES